MTAAEHGPRRLVRDRWPAISATIAGLSLAGALIFNGCQIEAGADAQRQAKLASELALMAQVQTSINQSVYSRTPFTNQFRRLRAGKIPMLGPRAYRRTAEEGATLDYVAWLFNEGYISAGEADQLWGPRMVCEYQRALAPGLLDPAHDLAELVEFIQERGRRLSRLIEGC